MLPKRRITTHPGEVLQEEFLVPLGISQSGLARHLGVAPHVICELANGKRSISPRMALMLSRALGTSAEFWIGLQADYDLTSTLHSDEGKRLQSIPLIIQPNTTG